MDGPFSREGVTPWATAPGDTSPSDASVNTYLLQYHENFVDQGSGNHGSRARCGSIDGWIWLADKCSIVMKNVSSDFFDLQINYISTKKYPLLHEA